jgi:hypothetical protein
MTRTGDENLGLYKLGGAAFIASGILFLARGVLEFIGGPKLYSMR